MLSFTVPAVTTAEADAYVAAGGVSGWPADDTAKAQALTRGQRYVAARFNARWGSVWVDPPEAVKLAIIEAAIIEARTPGLLSPVQNPDDKVLVQAGDIRWERVKGGPGADAYVPKSALIEGLLHGLVQGGSGSVSFLTRA